MKFLFPLLSAGAATVADYKPEQYDIGLFSAIDGVIVAIGGYAVVFVGLIALMAVVMIIGRIFSRKNAEKKVEKVAAAPVQTTVEVADEAPVAPGTAGQLKLHDVNPKTAAMLMAIVADKMGKPLNELRFISIKEVK